MNEWLEVICSQACSWPAFRSPTLNLFKLKFLFLKVLSLKIKLSPCTFNSRLFEESARKSLSLSFWFQKHANGHFHLGKRHSSGPYVRHGKSLPVIFHESCHFLGPWKSADVWRLEDLFTRPIVHFFACLRSETSNVSLNTNLLFYIWF